MRILPFVTLAALMVGCATAPRQDDGASSTAGETSAQDESVAYGPCNASRATILASVSAQRAAAISRGFTWLDADVPFSETDTYGTYRTDCSGFVSMCWSLGAPGLNTNTLGTSGSGSSKLSSYDDLVPADALVHVGHHSVVFLGWNDSAHSGACVLEQSSTINNMQFRVRLKSELQGDGFVPMRSDAFANDTTVYAPGQTPSPTTPDAGTDTSDTSDTSDTGSSGSSGSSGTNTITSPPSNDTTPDAPPVCTSTSVDLVCAAAYATGIECGRVIDNCGRAVDCTGEPGFGCGTGETCNANTCTSTCVPKDTADLCYSERLKSGLECGQVSDGCGGTVDCGDLPYFRCIGGATCGDDNKCTGGSQSAPTGGVEPDHCEGPQDNVETCPASTQPAPVKGDSGDDEAKTQPSSTRTASNDIGLGYKAPSNTSPGVASGGCSSAPGGSGSGFGSLALACLVILAARRRRAAL